MHLHLAVRQIVSQKFEKNLYVFADKTSNNYELSNDGYDKLLTENATKTYQKSPIKLEQAINCEAKQIAEHLELVNRLEYFANISAYTTLKKHKKNFSTKSR